MPEDRPVAERTTVFPLQTATGLVILPALGTPMQGIGGVKVNFLPARFAITDALIELFAVTPDAVEVAAGVTLRNVLAPLSPTDAETEFVVVYGLLYTISITLVVS